MQTEPFTAPQNKRITAPLLPDNLFGDPIKVIAPEQIYQLTPQQQQSFLEYFEQPTNQSVLPNRRIFNFLKNHLTQFNFHSATFTAAEALQKNKGNCLSLAILTRALADIAQVEIKYQLVATPPVYQRENNIIISSEHIRTQLFNPKQVHSRGIVYFGRGSILVDYFPTRGTRMLREVDALAFSAMYYRNIAGQFIIEKNYHAAYWYLIKSFELKRGDPHAINMMALLYDASDYPEAADKLFQFGLKYTNEKLDLLNNYHSFLKKHHRYQEANVIALKLENYDDPNPFRWINLANNEYNEQNYEKALTYFRKANRLAPYLHETYAGMAKTYFQMGKLKSAQKSILKAIENAHKNKTKTIYQAKLDHLSHLLTKN